MYIAGAAFGSTKMSLKSTRHCILNCGQDREEESDSANNDNGINLSGHIQMSLQSHQRHYHFVISDLCNRQKLQFA